MNPLKQVSYGFTWLQSLDEKSWQFWDSRMNFKSLVGSEQAVKLPVLLDQYPEYLECFLDGIDLKLYYIFAIW